MGTGYFSISFPFTALEEDLSRRVFDTTARPLCRGAIL